MLPLELPTQAASEIQLAPDSMNFRAGWGSRESLGMSEAVEGQSSEANLSDEKGVTVEPLRVEAAEALSELQMRERQGDVNQTGSCLRRCSSFRYKPQAEQGAGEKRSSFSHLLHSLDAAACLLSASHRSKALTFFL